MKTASLSLSLQDELEKHNTQTPSLILYYNGKLIVCLCLSLLIIRRSTIVEKASSTFPNTQVMISTLLPRKYFHHATIERVNACIARECVSKPNVFGSRIGHVFDRVVYLSRNTNWPLPLFCRERSLGASSPVAWQINKLLSKTCPIL